MTRRCERCPADITKRHRLARLCFDCLYGRTPAKPRLYVSGPMSGLPELNFPAFNEAAAALRARGFSVVNPAEINVDPAAGWEQCMRADIRALMDCDGVALLPGWAASRGAILEIHNAAALKMQVHTVDEWLRVASLSSAEATAA